VRLKGLDEINILLNIWIRIFTMRNSIMLVEEGSKIGFFLVVDGHYILDTRNPSKVLKNPSYHAYFLIILSGF
jgi:hypothetical protein